MSMRLNIKNPETDRLARQLAAVTGESITTAVTTAVRERLELIRSVTHPDSSRGTAHMSATVPHVVDVPSSKVGDEPEHQKS